MRVVGVVRGVGTVTGRGLVGDVDVFEAFVGFGQRAVFGKLHRFEDRGLGLAVDFIEQLREQKKFDGPEALVAQIEADVAKAKEILAGGR